MPKRKNFSKIDRRRIWDCNVGIDKGTSKCFICNISIIDMVTYEIGHKIALSKGGSNNYDNLIPICASCNRSQGTKSYDDVTDKKCIQYSQHIPTKHRKRRKRRTKKDLLHDVTNFNMTFTGNDFIDQELFFNKILEHNKKNNKYISADEVYTNNNYNCDEDNFEEVLMELDEYYNN